MKRSLAIFPALSALFFICACGAGGAQDTPEVLDGPDDIQAPDPQATLESAPDPQSEEPTDVDVDSTTVPKVTAYPPCSSSCVKISVSNLTGLPCCTCSGTGGNWVRSAWSPTTFLCS